jgi:hypothetical protein
MDSFVDLLISSSDTEVALELTPEGQAVYEAHQEYHHQFYQSMELAMTQAVEQRGYDDHSLMFIISGPFLVYPVGLA